MENLKSKLFFLVLFSLLIGSNEAKKNEKKFLHIAYFKHIFGHIHKNPSRYSQSFSTLECGHPVKIYALIQGGREKVLFEKRFYYVKAGPYEGYIDQSHLSLKRGPCFQRRFPKFFDQLSLKLSDMFYWGKLYDQYLYGKSKVQ